MSILQITIKVDGAAAATPKVRRDALRDGFQLIAELWDRDFKMLRFTDAGAKRYHFAPRAGEPGSGRKFAGSYTQAKLRRRKNGQGVQAIGETKPLVWSGDSRNKARAQQKIEARAGSSSRAYARNIFDIPTLNLTPKGGRIKPREEFQRVIESERRYLENRGILRYEVRLAQATPVTIKR